MTMRTCGDVAPDVSARNTAASLRQKPTSLMCSSRYVFERPTRDSPSSALLTAESASMVLPSAVTQLLSTCTELSVCAKYLARVLATHLA